MSDELDIEIEVVSNEPRMYEISYLFVPILAEAGLLDEVTKIKALIGTISGTILSEGNPKTITLAYPMAKTVSNKKTVFTSAYFGWVKFEGKAGSVNEIKKALDANDVIIRFLITKTTKETPQFIKPRAPLRMTTPIKKEEPQKEGKEGPLDEAALDKEIEELLVS